MTREYTGKKVIKRLIAFSLCTTVAVTTAFFGVPLGAKAAEEDNTVYTIGVKDDRNWTISENGADGEAGAISTKGVLLWSGDQVISSSRSFSEDNTMIKCHHGTNPPPAYWYSHYVGFTISSADEAVTLDALGDLVSGEAEMITGGTMNSTTGETDGKTTGKLAYGKSFTAKTPVFVEYDKTTNETYSTQCDCEAKTEWNRYQYYLYSFKVHKINTSPVTINFANDAAAFWKSETYPKSVGFEISKDDTIYKYEVPTKIGYVFDGWDFKDSSGNDVSGVISDSKDGTITFAGVNGSNWQTMDAMSKDGSITATPTWKQKDLTIHYDPDGGVYSSSVCIVTKNNKSYDLNKDDTSLFAEAKREGYTFEGWYLDDTKLTCLADIPKTKWDSSQIYDVKAKWTSVNPPDYTIDATNGTLTVKSENGFPSQEYGEYAKRVIVNKGITEIPIGAFQYFKMEEIELPDTIKTIGNAAFLGCDRLKTITIPEGVTEIKYRCFDSCNEMEEVVLPDSVVSIGETAFNYVGSNLTTGVTIRLSSQLESIGQYVFCNANIAEIYIPGSITAISDKAFLKANIAAVTFAGTEEQWAALCEQAEELKAATVTYVEPVAPHVHDAKLVPEVAATCTMAGVKAYYTCTCGKYFEDKDCKTIISDLAAWQTGAGLLAKKEHSLKKTVAKTATCTTAGNQEYWTCDCGKWFADAAATKEITDKTSVAVAATGHKWDDGKVTKEATASEAGAKTFTCSVCGATKTESIPATGSPEKGETVKDDKGTASYVVTGTDEKNPTVTYAGTEDSKAKTVKIPSTVEVDGVTYQVTAIADNACKNNKTITKVTIPKNVTTIGKNAFSGCTKLKTVSIGSRVTTVEANAFKGCKALTKITLPEKTTKIGANAFDGCKNLKTITIKSKKLTAKSISKNAFKGISSKVTIKVPKGKAKTYRALFRKKGLNKKITVK